MLEPFDQELKIQNHQPTNRERKTDENLLVLERQNAMFVRELDTADRFGHGVQYELSCLVRGTSHVKLRSVSHVFPTGNLH